MVDDREKIKSMIRKGCTKYHDTIGAARSEKEVEARICKITQIIREGLEESKKGCQPIEAQAQPIGAEQSSEFDFEKWKQKLLGKT